MELSSNKKTKSSLQFEGIVVEEYKYAGAYTLQVLQERGNMLTIYLSLVTAITGLAGLRLFEKVNINYEEILSPVLLVLGSIHLLLYLRFAHLEKKYHSYQTRMNKIRNFYVLKNKNVYPELSDLLSPLIMPKAKGTIYPIWPTTMLFPVIASVSFAGAFWLWNQEIAALLTFIISFWVMIKLGRRTTTS